MVTEVAYQVVKEDALPLTLEAKVVAGYLPEENHWMAEAVREVVVGDPSVDRGLTGVAEVVPPYRDASHDAEDDE